jgi:outer membrane protein assembly factor BamB
MIRGNLCFIYHGPGKPSDLVALDKKTGKVVWQVALPESHPKERFDGFAGKSDGMLGSFASPLIVPANGREELVLALGGTVHAFDPATGKTLWTCTGMNPLVYASPTYGEGVLVAMGGFFGSTLFIKPGGSGDVTQSHRTWYEQRAKKHRIGSPIIKDGYIYFSNTIGVAECVELATGKAIWEERLPVSGSNGETWASMVLAGDRLYVVNQSGDTLVLRAAPKYELIASNPVGETSNSTLALSQGDIFLRTHKALWCIADSKSLAAAE